MTPKRATLYLAGGALLAWWLKDKVTYKDPGKATPLYVPPNAIPQFSNLRGSMAQPPDAPPQPTGPVQLQSLDAKPGMLYRAVVNVNGPLSWLANVSKVASAAAGQGFSNPQVSKSPPPGWPGNIRGDYYVTGVYQGAPQTFSRSNAGGEVQIVDCWEG